MLLALDVVELLGLPQRGVSGGSEGVWGDWCTSFSILGLWMLFVGGWNIGVD